MRTWIDIFRYTLIMLMGALLLLITVSLVFLGRTALEAMILAVMFFPLMFLYFFISVIAMDILLRLITVRMILIKGGKKQWNKRRRY